MPSSRCCRSLPALAPSARLVTDTGSTKRQIVDAARAAGVVNFVAGHPMAGGTSSGPARAPRGAVRRASLVPPHRTGFTRRGDNWRPASSVTWAPCRCRSTTTAMSTIGWSAAISHLPQVVASALLARVGESVGPAVKFAGAGLRDTTRLAASQASVWAPILATNAAAVAPLLKALARDLDAVADATHRRARNRAAVRAGPSRHLRSIITACRR